MVLDADAAYLALKARDARFDGRLFVGVTSTGVYCRPVCRVRTPRRENCRFFDTPAQAEAARFRPCLKCRPELAPGLSAMDSSASLASSAALAIGQAVQRGEPLSMGALAARLGVTDRHLRRIFVAAHGVTPQAWRDTQRLLLAKQLLTDTREPVAQVALASGFGSLRRFNAAFVSHYRLQPGQLRRQAGATPAAPPPRPRAGVHLAQPRPAPVDPGAAPRDAATTVRLAYRPPYDVAGLLRFCHQRAVPGLEEVAMDGPTRWWRRTLQVAHRGRWLAGWLQAEWVDGSSEVRLQVSTSLVPALGAVLQATRQALDLDADPGRIDPLLATLPVPPAAGLRLPGAWDGFEAAVRIVLGQQVSVKAAVTLTQRLVHRFGTPLATPFPALTHAFPRAEQLAAAQPQDLGALGIVRQRVGALQALARAVADGRLALHRGAPLPATLETLRALPGVGEWTAQLVAMRSLAWPDAWPASDLGLMQALGTRHVPTIEQHGERWRPWRAYAVMALWQGLVASAPAPSPLASPHSSPPSSLPSSLPSSPPPAGEPAER